MKLKRIDPKNAETRAFFLHSYRKRPFGRSSAIADCPFCGTRNSVYLWSLAGGGKRCENPSCRAHLLRGIAVRDLVPIDERKEAAE